jgi:lipopolysaccharide export LptBFGC system permease protein LptF
MQRASTFAPVRDPLQGYLSGAYFRWFVPMFGFGALSATQLESSFGYALGPLAALFSPLALCGVTYILNSRREIEALQAYGVSFHRFWRPLSVAAAIPTIAICIVGIAIAPRPVIAAALAVVAAAVSSWAFALLARRAWRSTIR